MSAHLTCLYSNGRVTTPLDQAAPHGAVVEGGGDKAGSNVVRRTTFQASNRAFPASSRRTTVIYTNITRIYHECTRNTSEVRFYPRFFLGPRHPP